ncbi:MAG: hypothetical protein ABEI52_10555, partial [Halobacteriaceae archaeon]
METFQTLAYALQFNPLLLECVLLSPRETGHDQSMSAKMFLSLTMLVAAIVVILSRLTARNIHLLERLTTKSLLANVTVSQGFVLIVVVG